MDLLFFGKKLLKTWSGRSFNQRIVYYLAVPPKKDVGNIEMISYDACFAIFYRIIKLLKNRIFCYIKQCLKFLVFFQGFSEPLYINIHR